MTLRICVLGLAFLTACGGGARVAPARVGGGCTYQNYPGNATITRIERLPGGGASAHFSFTPSDPGAIATYRFPGDGDADRVLHMDGTTAPSPQELERRGIRPGAMLPCVRWEIRTGTCTPRGFSFPSLAGFSGS